MGADKVVSKSGSGGFFNLFDWNKKSLKRLFSSDGKVQANQVDCVLSTPNDQVNEDQNVGMDSAKGSSVYSCASSAIDDAEKSNRGPGVVARLMGLDSMPAGSSVSEPCSDPFYDSVSLRDDGSDISSLSSNVMRSNAYSMELLDARSPKLCSSPFERFHMEALPPRLVRPNSQQKLLSPVRSPRRSSVNNTSRIVEAAAKRLEPELRSSNVLQSRSSRSLSSPLRGSNSQRMNRKPKKSKPLESPRDAVDTSVEKSLNGEACSGSSQSLENVPIPRSLSHNRDGSSAGTKGKEKIVSLAVQAKLNVQRREQTAIKSDKKLGQKGDGETSLNNSSNQTGSQKHNKHNRLSTKNASSSQKPKILKQNHTPNRSNVAIKPPAHNQHGNNTLPGDSSNRDKVSSKNSKHSSGGSQTTKSGNEKFQSNSNRLTQKKRLVETNSPLEKNGSIDNVTASRHGKQVRHIIVLDENSKPSYDDNLRNGSDVVSFTFATSMKNSVHDLTPSEELAIRGRKNGYHVSYYEDNVDLIAEDSSSQLDAEEVDSLGILIEKKLRELAYVSESPYTKVARESGQGPSPIFNGSAYEHKIESVLRPGYEEVDGSFSSSTSITSDKESSICQKLEIDHQDQSPLSILEHTFSNESCSSESWDSAGSKINCSSIVPQEIGDCNLIKKVLSMEQEPEMLDSTSALSIQTTDGSLASEFCQEFHHNYSCNVEVDYVREILINRELMFGNFLLFPTGSSSRVLAPVIFDKLEESINFVTADEEEENDCRVERKMLFDSVNEYLEMMLAHNFQAGYRAWAKGIAAIKKDLAEDIYEELSKWTCIGDWMVDELVEKDMSTYLGRWTNFEIEAFEIGREIEVEVLNCLIDEVAAELLSRPAGIRPTVFPSSLI